MHSLDLTAMKRCFFCGKKTYHNDSFIIVREAFSPFVRPIRQPYVLKNSIAWRQLLYRLMEILRCMNILRCMSKNRLYTKMLRIHLFSVFIIKTPRDLTALASQNLLSWKHWQMYSKYYIMYTMMINKQGEASFMPVKKSTGLNLHHVCSVLCTDS